MMKLNKTLHEGMVVWARRAEFYDHPGWLEYNQNAMYVVTYINKNYFFGSPLEANSSKSNSTILCKSIYPIRVDSRIAECIYKIPFNDIISSKIFEVNPRTFEHFKRKLYERIVIDQMDSPKEYNDIYVNEYRKTHNPKKENIVVYPSEEKVFKHYYVCDELENDFVLVELNKDGKNFTIRNPQKILKPKESRFYTYYTEHNFDY